MVEDAVRLPSGGTPPLRIIFFGTPLFAVPTLAALLKSRHKVVAVVSQPDRPKGRGQRVAATPTKEMGVLCGVPVLQPTRLRDESFLADIATLRADLGVVAAYGRILPDALLTLPRLGLINVHASLLPAYRGAAPVHRAVIAGDAVTGVTIMRVVRELDAGPMIASVTVPIGPDSTSPEIEALLAARGAALLIDVVEQLAAGIAVETPQDDALATYAPKILKAEGPIDWSLPAARIHNLVRGLQPWPLASTTIGGSRLLLHRTAVTGATGDAAPGTVVRADPDALAVATGSDLLRVLQVQLEGRRPIAAREFLSGHRVAVGTRLPS
jgi:methionyl-tRNA formyltransferase